MFKKSMAVILSSAMMLTSAGFSMTAFASDTEAAGDKPDITIAYVTEILDENETGYADAVQYGIDE